MLHDLRLIYKRDIPCSWEDLTLSICRFFSTPSTDSKGYLENQKNHNSIDNIEGEGQSLRTYAT